jgi:hypothetical protein
MIAQSLRIEARAQIMTGALLNSTLFSCCDSSPMRFGSFLLTNGEVSQPFYGQNQRRVVQVRAAMRGTG